MFKKVLSKKLGFSLAEVLITLAIIGVVAAITISNLYSNYQKNTYINELKKAYAEISQAFKLMMANDNINNFSLSDSMTCLDENGNCSSAEVVEKVKNNFFKKYFKIIKDCGSENPSSCFAQEYKNIEGSIINRPECLYSMVTVGGISICLKTIATSFVPGTLVIDINGLKRPNIGGRDLFNFTYYHDGSLDESVNPECRKGVENLCRGLSNAKEIRITRFYEQCLSGGYGAGCFDKILNDNWKMDY